MAESPITEHLDQVISPVLQASVSQLRRTEWPTAANETRRERRARASLRDCADSLGRKLSSRRSHRTESRISEEALARPKRAVPPRLEFSQNSRCPRQL